MAAFTFQKRSELESMSSLSEVGFTFRNAEGSLSKRSEHPQLNATAMRTQHSCLPEKKNSGLKIPYKISGFGFGLQQNKTETF